MKKNSTCNKIEVKKCLFALPRGRLCIRKHPIKRLLIEIQEEEEDNDGLHEG